MKPQVRRVQETLDALGIDRKVIYPAGGVPECVFPIAPGELLRATGGTIADLKTESS